MSLSMGLLGRGCRKGCEDVNQVCEEPSDVLPTGMDAALALPQAHRRLLVSSQAGRESSRSQSSRCRSCTAPSMPFDDACNRQDCEATFDL